MKIESSEREVGNKLPFLFCHSSVLMFDRGIRTASELPVLGTDAAPTRPCSMPLHDVLL